MMPDLNSIFFPHDSQKRYEISSQNKRFIHYTTAESAVNIIRNKEIWMRNATCMNDFMEVEYGLSCLKKANNSPESDKLKIALNNIFPGIIDEIIQLFDGWLPHFQYQTYILSISEHLPSEDILGRLSMWRAYGKQSGVAFVVYNYPFFGTANLKAYSSAVAYLDMGEFKYQLSKIAENVINFRSFISSLDRKIIVNAVFQMLRFSILCTKHPGFQEEREWRIIYSPTLETSPYIYRDIHVINGTPQKIYKIHLKDIPEIGLFGITIPQFLERIIIGPTQYPYVMHDTFVDLLNEAGVQNPINKVFTSDIPLRR